MSQNRLLHPVGTGSRSGTRLLILVLLTAAICLVYAPVGSYSFLNLDDDLYVTSNPEVLKGLSWEGIQWSMGTLEAAFWHPVTWWSHMLDVQLFGLNPAGHHAMNVVLHLINTLLLFKLLESMTRSLWPSALVAILFALHPINVESVAWVAERKNVLSTLLGFLSLWAYYRYTRNPGLIRYLLMLIGFLLGLMAKPMLVTLPCLFLLLDYWPLKRCPSLREWRLHAPALVREKLPLLLPVAGVSLLAVRAQAQAGALPNLQGLPLDARAANAVICYALYLKKLVWPTDLAVFYPHPGTAWSGSSLLLAALTLLILSALIAWRGERSPYLIVGWLWYLGTLFPVSGLVQVGGHAMADRYAYLPFVGLFLILAWGARDLLASRPGRNGLLPSAALILTLILMVSSRSQLRYWKDTASLFEHALRVTEDNPVAHNVLAVELMVEGRLAEALFELQRALALQPDYADAHGNLGLAFSRMDRPREAVRHYRKAIELDPNAYEAHNNLGLSLAKQGRSEEAEKHFLRSLEINPQYVEAYNNLGATLVQQDKTEEAIRWFRKAVEIRPDFAPAHYNLGSEYLKRGKDREATEALLEALKLQPDYPEALVNLSVLLKRNGRTEEAREALERALELKPDLAQAHNNLGILLAGQGDRSGAALHLREALRLAPDYTEARHNLEQIQRK